jgi:hypothetical protein
MSMSVHPKAEAIVHECVVRMQARLMYTEQEALAAIRATISKPAPKKIKAAGTR